jgi:L-proline amide hydrolase
MLACEHAVKQPFGLRSLILASSPSDLSLGMIEINLLRDQLPFEVHQTLLKHEQAGTTDDPEYQAAVNVFNSRHVCRVPAPAELIATETQFLADPTVYLTMCGPSEFYITGTLK